MSVNLEGTSGLDLVGSFLYVHRVSPEEYFVLQQIIQIWQQTIAEKVEKVQTRLEISRFRDCRSILNAIAVSLNPKCAEQYQTFLCVSDNNVPHGIMQIKKSDSSPEDLIVHTLVTNPINLRSSVNQNEENRVEGVGSFLLRNAEQIAREQGKQRVRLIPYQSALLFYQKLGFIADESSFDVVKKITEAAKNVSTNEAA